MKKTLLLATTVLAAGFLTTHALAANEKAAVTATGATRTTMTGADTATGADTIVSKTGSETNKAVDAQTISDPRRAAEGMLEHINYARVALAMNNADQAKNHLAQAQTLMAVVKSAAVDQRRVANVQSSRVDYGNETESKLHYFPIETAPVTLKTVETGPLWANDGLAVTNAEMVSLTLDLNNDNVDVLLQQAVDAVNSNNFDQAQDKLAELTYDIVSVNESVDMPVTKARDNIALAHKFLSMKNYDGARYALDHADDALDAMERSEQYATHRTAVIGMRQEVKAMQETIQKRDPTMLDKAGDKLSQWWNDMKDWVDAKTSEP